MAKILVVDDNPDAADALGKVFKQSGHEVISVSDGREALIQVLQNTPDVVLLDLVMPVMDGPSFLEVVRSYLRLQSLPIVVHTAFTDNPMIDRVQNLKVNAVLAKAKSSSTDVLKALEAAIAG